MKYENIEILVIELSNEDVIRTSNPNEGFYGDDHELTPFG